MFQDYRQRNKVKKYATLDMKEKKSLSEEFLLVFYSQLFPLAILHI